MSSLPERIARAVKSVIDPVAEMPFLNPDQTSIEEVNLLLDEYIATLQSQLLEIISTHGETFLDAGDAAGLCAVCIASGIDLPPDTLLQTCQAIVQESVQHSEYIADTPNGEPIYMVALEI